MRRTVISVMIISGLVAGQACKQSTGPVNPQNEGGVVEKISPDSTTATKNAQAPANVEVAATPAASPDQYLAKLESEKSVSRTMEARRTYPMREPEAEDREAKAASATPTVLGSRAANERFGNRSIEPSATPSPLPSIEHKSPGILSGGVLNGKAISMPKPSYPPIAKTARASGTVVVEVTVDESGRVIRAHAVSGHPLLQQAAVQAAYQARFAPIQISSQPVKVTGVITYNFVLQ